MKESKKPKKRVLILSARTGGGHRAAAEAVMEQLNIKGGDEIEVIDVDVLQDYAPKPISELDRYYPRMVKIPQAWGTAFKLTATERRAKSILRNLARYAKKEIAKMFAENPSDVIVSFHFMGSGFLGQLEDKKDRPYFIQVVTDLVSGHPMWYDNRIDLCIVPTEEAYESAEVYGMDGDKMKVIGLPVSERFMTKHLSASEARKQLKWSANRRTILVMCGGDGMGRVRSVVRALDKMSDNFDLAIVCGRNEKLLKSFKRRQFKHKVHLYGFSTEIPAMMRAASVLVSKAGPGTVSEALVSNLPVLLYDYLPGQEEGNVVYVVKNQIGGWAPTSKDVRSLLKSWLRDEKQLNSMKSQMKRLSLNHAASEIAEIIIDKVKSN